MKEIDIIIENWLQKIVEDKINAAVDNIDFNELAQNLLANKFSEELSKLKLPKISEKLTMKEICNIINTDKSRYSSHDPVSNILSNSLKNWLEKFLSEKLDISWHEANLFENGNLDVKKKILKNVKENNRFVKFFTDFLNK